MFQFLFKRSVLVSYRGMSKADLRASLLGLQGRTDTLKLVKDE